MLNPKRDRTTAKLSCRPLRAAVIFALVCSPAFASQKYQTDIGPTPRDGRNSANVQGRGAAQATLNGSNFTVHGTFAGLAGAATDAHLCMGNVMGGTGPSIYDLKITKAQKGEFGGAVTLTSDQVLALNAGRIYVLLNSQTAPHGNLWGWFQPGHLVAKPDVPQDGNWYIPNILTEQGVPPS